MKAGACPLVACSRVSADAPTARPRLQLDSKFMAATGSTCYSLIICVWDLTLGESARLLLAAGTGAASVWHGSTKACGDPLTLTYACVRSSKGNNTASNVYTDKMRHTRHNGILHAWFT